MEQRALNTAPYVLQNLSQLPTFKRLGDYVHLVGENKTWSSHSELQIVISFHLFRNLLRTPSCLAVSPKEVLCFWSSLINPYSVDRGKNTQFHQERIPGRNGTWGCCVDRLFLGFVGWKPPDVHQSLGGIGVRSPKIRSLVFVETKGTASTQMRLHSGKLI